MKNIIISSVLALSAGLAMVGPANAATNHSSTHATHMQHQKSDNNPLSKLNLSAKQQAKIKDIKQKHRNDGKKGHEQAKKEIAKVLTSKQRNQLEKMSAEHRANGDHQDRDDKNRNR